MYKLLLDAVSSDTFCFVPLRFYKIHCPVPYLCTFIFSRHFLAKLNTSCFAVLFNADITETNSLFVHNYLEETDCGVFL